MGMRKTARKLEMALNLRGDNIILEEKRFFSTKYQKIMTCYKVVRCQPGEQREILIKSWSLKDATLYLAKLYLNHEDGDGSG